MNTDQNNQQDEHLTRSQSRAISSGIEAERSRMREIAALGRQHNLVEAADRAIDSGQSLDAFREVVLGSIKDTGRMRASESPELGLTSREAAQYSFQKAINSQLDPNYARRDGGFEIECSRAMAQKLGKEPSGFYVPNEVLRNNRNQQRDLLVGTPTAGGYMVATDHAAASFVDLLRKKSRVLELGATTISDLVGNLSIPKQEGGASVFWVAENGAVTESSQVFGQILMTPKTVGGFTDYSRRMMLQSSPDIEMIIRRDLAGQIAADMDRVAIAGPGTGNQPLGILGTSGIGAVPIGTNGGAVTWTHILQLEEALVNANADDGLLGYMTNGKVRRALKGTTKVSGDAGAGFIWDDAARETDGFGTLNGYRGAVDNNVPSNLTKGSGTGLSAMIFANWADLVIAQWGSLDIYVDKSANATSGGTRVVAFMDMDVAVRRPASFAAIIDAIA